MSIVPIVREWINVPNRDRFIPEINEIFFEASENKSFLNDSEKDAFRERWLGLYLANYPEWAYMSFDGDKVVGYLVGCLDDPARTPLFSDLVLYKEFHSVTALYPAHFHINLHSGWRGQGIGSRMVEFFASDASIVGARGMHVITSRGMENVRFYEECDFHEVGAIKWRDRELVFLGRKLSK
jgi:GNAT superfamily N-acetyltransferase